MHSENMGRADGYRLTQLDGEIQSLIQNLRQQATRHQTLEEFVTKVVTSVHTELQAAEENIAILKILDVLSHVNSAIANVSNFEERRHLLSNIAETVLEILAADIVVVYEIAEDGEQVIAKPGWAGELYNPQWMLDVIRPSAAVYQFLSIEEPTYLENADSDERLVTPLQDTSENLPERFTLREKVRSTAVIPLFFNHSPVGLIFANYRTPQSFGELRRQKIKDLSKHIALAIYNLRSYKRTVDLNKRLELLFELIKAAINQMGDRQALLDTIIKGAVELIEAPRGAIVWWEKARDYGEVVAQFTESTTTPLSVIRIPKSSFLQQKILQGQAYRIDNIDTYQEISDDERKIFQANDIKSTMIVPVVDESKQVVASIGIDETRRYRSFSDQDLYLCQILASQMGIVLRLAESVAEMQMIATVRDLQQRAIDAVTDPDPDNAFELIVEGGLALINGKNGQLLRLNSSGRRLETDYSSNPQEIGLWYPVDRSITGRAVSRRESILIGDLDEEPEYKTLYQPGYEVGMKCELSVPLINNAVVIGVLNAESPEPYAFTPQHQRIWEELANSVVKIIRLTQTNAENYALTSSLEIQQANLRGEGANLPELLSKILQTAFDLADAHIGQLILIEEDGTLVISHSSEKDIGEKLSIDRSVTGIAIKQAATIRVDDLENDVDPEFGPYRHIHQWFSDERSKMLSELVVPLKYDGTVIGVINLENDRTYAFTEFHASLVEILANQAASLIQQARMIEQQKLLEAQALESKLEIERTRDIANILHRLNNPLGAVRQFTMLAIEGINAADGASPALIRDLQRIQENADKMAALVNELRSDLRDIDAKPLNVNEQVEAAIRKWRDQWGDHNLSTISVNVKLAAELPPAHCGNKLEYVIHDLLNNSVEALLPDRTGVIQVRTLHTGDWIEIQVEDNGGGIADNLREVIFEESFSTKTSSGRMMRGIGLWWDRPYIRSFGGDIVVLSSEINVGTVMAVRLRPWALAMQRERDQYHG